MNGRRWRFRDFVDQGNENQIKRWSDKEGAELKARLNALIRNLEVLDRAFTRADSVGLLRKPGSLCHGEQLIELIIKINRVQYRPIGWYGPDVRNVTLLLGAIESDGDFVPRNACAIAIQRKRLIGSDRKYVIDHNFE